MGAFFSIALCFPADTTVMTPQGAKRMGNVNVGDTVRVVSQDGKLAWSQVCGWAHREPTTTAGYLRLTTSHRQLVVSADHLVATISASGTNISFVPAKDVKVGDRLLECDNTPQGTSGVWANGVVTVDIITAQGVFAPLTLAGTVVVDGVAASCYAATQSHTVAHAAMKPVRAGWRHNPEKRAIEAEHSSAKHVAGSHRYVDVLAHVARKA